MKLVRVEIPFHLRATNTDYAKGDTLEVDEETLSRLRALNINQVIVLGEVEHEEVTEEESEETVEVTEEEAQQEELVEQKPKQRKTIQPK